MDSVRVSVRFVAALAALLLVLTACSAIGSRQSGSPLAQASPAPAVSTTASPTPFETVAGATSVVTGTIYPETFDPNATPPSEPSPTPLPTSQPAGLADLIYALVAQLGDPDWCDPDYYPIAHADDIALAREHLVEMQADAALYQTILSHNGMSAGEPLSDEQLVIVYRDWKILTKAIVLSPTADGYTFDYVVLRGPQGQQMDHHVAGTISASGQISSTVDEPTSAPNCPICLARGTLIDTPNRPIRVEDVTPGTIVWTQDESGARVASPVKLVGSTPVPPTHEVVRLVLADGRTLDVSPGHPLASGEPVGHLRAGDALDGSTVLSADLIAYAGGATFDLLPAGGTGLYWANGILIGSTLFVR